MGFRKDFRELISFFSNRPKGYIPDQESVGGDRVKIGGISNRGSVKMDGFTPSIFIGMRRKELNPRRKKNKEGSNPGVRWKLHPENGSQGRRRRRAAGAVLRESISMMTCVSVQRRGQAEDEEIDMGNYADRSWLLWSIYHSESFY